MKAKFTILVAAGLALAVGTQAQGFKKNEGYSKNSHFQIPPAKFEREKKTAYYESKYNSRKMARFHKRELKRERRNARHHFMKKW